VKCFIFLASLFLSITVLGQDFSFIAVGDTGKGNDGQYRIGATMTKVCAEIDCQFVTMLGDNFYNVGVSSPNDPQFVDKFEKPYATLDVPFYISLGNHDYGQFANEWRRGGYQIQYGKKNPKWILPSFYYTFEKNDVLFIVLDTTRLFHNKDVSKQVSFIRKAIRENTKKWVIVVGHHPYISNGEHGSAGSYDGVLVPPFSGNIIKEVFENELCPYVDLVLAGHDHSLQSLPGTAACPKPLFVVSGGGASASSIKRNNNPYLYQKAILGFTTVKVSASELEVSHINVDGAVEHTTVVEKR
jgi:hypothetical protein